LGAPIDVVAQEDVKRASYGVGCQVIVYAFQQLSQKFRAPVYISDRVDTNAFRDACGRFLRDLRQRIPHEIETPEDHSN
jgi:hypothetical protein